MLIKELTIANFRGIREGKLSDLVQVNILVGRNNTGKSTVLEALALMAYGAGRSLPGPKPQRDLLGRLMPRYLFVHRVKRTSLYKEELHFGFMDGNRIEILAVFEDGDIVKLSDYSVFSTPKARGGVEENRKQLARAVLVDASLAGEFGTIEATLWQRIKADRRDRELKEVVAEAYHMEIDNFSFIPFDGSYKLAIETRERSIPVDVVGDGLRHALAVLSVAVLASNSALMIEEMETHQHPESLQKLLVALFKMAKRNSTQLFMSTHSLELISYALEAAEKESLELKVYHCTLSQDGVLTARGIPAPDAKLLTDMGHDLRMQHKFVRS